MVQNVEGVELEFEFQLLSQGGDLESAEVKGDVTGSAEGVPAAVSKNLFVGGNAKSIDVEPLLNRARSIGAHPRHDRADVFFKIGARVDGGAARDQTGERKTGVQHRDSAYLPSARDLVQDAGPTSPPALLGTKGKFVERTRYPVVFYVEDR